MNLRWDAPLVRHLARELDELLSGSRLRALRLDGDARDLVLFFREHTLLWRLHPTRGGLRLLEPADPGPHDLRLPMRVRRIRAPLDERILIMELLPTRGGRKAMDLVVELLGNQWNAVVAEGPEARIRHVLVSREGDRPLTVGAGYQPPAPSPREGADGTLSLERWRALLEPAPPPDRKRELVSSVAWTSPLNAPALLDDLEEGHALWLRLADPDTPTRPVVLETPRGPHPYPLPLPAYPSHPVDTLRDALDAAAEDAEEEDRAQALLLPPELVDALDRTLDTVRRRVTGLVAESDRLEDPAELRALGDLLLARYHQIPSSADRVTLEDFQGEEVELELDPGLAPNENADRYYEKAAKAERARERMPGLLAEARARRAELERLDARVRTGEATREELEAALPAEALRREESRSSDEGPTLPYTTFRSSGGLEIRVGKGARQNDDLTFHHSNPEDVWLHARQVPGAHVILRWGRQETPPARDLAEAAVLAAVHSKARTSGSVPVAWTFRKYVRSPRKAPPGMVVPERTRTLFVEPDEDLVGKLRVAE